MQNCDVLLAVGARFDDRVIGNPEHFGAIPRKIIHIDVDPSSIAKRVKVDVPIVGDVKDVLEDLLNALGSGEEKPDAKALKAAIARGTMPPWHADPARSVAFHNDRSLTAAERKTLIEWVDAGAPEGKAGAASPVKAEAGGWQLGKPDLVIRVPRFAVPASGTIEYTFLVTPTNQPEAKWIAAAEWKIDQRSVVHHMNAFVRPKGSSYVSDAPAGETWSLDTLDAQLGGWFADRDPARTFACTEVLTLS